MTGWWFGTFVIFPYIGDNHPNWLSYFWNGMKPPTRFHLHVLPCVQQFSNRFCICSKCPIVSSLSQASTTTPVVIRSLGLVAIPSVPLSDWYHSTLNKLHGFAFEMPRLGWSLQLRSMLLSKGRLCKFFVLFPSLSQTLLCKTLQPLFGCDTAAPGGIVVSGVKLARFHRVSPARCEL